jgi:hypothetical protein
MGKNQAMKGDLSPLSPAIALPPGFYRLQFREPIRLSQFAANALALKLMWRVELLEAQQ